MARITILTRLRELPWTSARMFRARVESLLPVLAPFSVAAAFVLFYCGPNVPRGLACLRTSYLCLASGPENRGTVDFGNGSNFYAFDLGEDIRRVIHKHCGKGAPWWSLDYWAFPDSFDRIAIEHRPSPGTVAAIENLFRDSKDRERIDFAVVQDGLIIDGEMQQLNKGRPDEILALVPLYKSILYVFAKRGGPYQTLSDLQGRNVRAYLGQLGSGSRNLVGKILTHFGIDCIDAHPDWTPSEVARAFTADKDMANDMEIAFFLDRIDSGVAREVINDGRYDLLSLEGVEDLFHNGASLAGRGTMRKVILPRAALSEAKTIPRKEVTTIETQAILACSADLPDWDAYQVARTLTEQSKELRLGSDVSAWVSEQNPGRGFDYPLHAGAERFYRHGKVEPFPYNTLVVAIGASVALLLYWNSHVVKRRADRLTREVDLILSNGDISILECRALFENIKLRALNLFKDGRINKEGYERVMEYVRMMQPLSGNATKDRAPLRGAGRGTGVGSAVANAKQNTGRPR